MNIIIHRKRTNNLYTEGELRINGKLQTYTVEATASMLPAGTYTLRPKLLLDRRYELMIYNVRKFTGMRIGLGHSWISSCKLKTICIGQSLIPGALYKGTIVDERIKKRIIKGAARKEPINLIIMDHMAIRNLPIRHWLTDHKGW